MAGDNWSHERMRLKPLHRRIEARCLEIAKKNGRTWLRMPYADRELYLTQALQGMDPGDVWRWSQRYSLGDILNNVIMPQRGQHSSARPGRAGNEE